MPTAKEMFEDFRKKECLNDVMIEIDWHFIPCIKITFCESACCDHQTYIEVQADDNVRFHDFTCDVENIELLARAINMLVAETWGGRK